MKLQQPLLFEQKTANIHFQKSNIDVENLLPKTFYYTQLTLLHLFNYASSLINGSFYLIKLLLPIFYTPINPKNTLIILNLNIKMSLYHLKLSKEQQENKRLNQFNQVEYKIFQYFPSKIRIFLLSYAHSPSSPSFTFCSAYIVFLYTTLCELQNPSSIGNFLLLICLIEYSFSSLSSTITLKLH
jgi:hypothetical protein